MNDLEERLGIDPTADDNVIRIQDFRGELKKIKDFASQKEFDYIDTRERLLSLIQMAEQAIDKLMTIAFCSEKSRDFEVLAKLFETVKQCNESLIEMHEKNQSKTNAVEKDVGEYLTTAELQKKLKDKK